LIGSAPNSGITIAFIRILDATPNTTPTTAADPAPRPHVADRTPWCPRQPDPRQGEEAADRHEQHRQDFHIAGERDDEHRDDPERPEPAQFIGERII
jgi:hypothetical protein